MPGMQGRNGEGEMSGQFVSKEQAVNAILSGMLDPDDSHWENPSECNSMLEWAADVVRKLPSVTLYGYELSFLFDIAIVMQHKGVSPEEALAIMRDTELLGEMLLEDIRRTTEKAMLRSLERREDERTD